MAVMQAEAWTRLKGLQRLMARAKSNAVEGNGLPGVLDFYAMGEVTERSGGIDGAGLAGDEGAVALSEGFEACGFGLEIADAGEDLGEGEAAFVDRGTWNREWRHQQG